MDRRRFLLTSLAGALALPLAASGCGSVPVVEQVSVPHVVPMPADARFQVLLLDRLVFDMPKGTVFGETRRGKACIAPEKLVWQSEAPRTFTEGSYHVTFGRIVADHGFKVPERPQSLFAQPQLTGQELFLAARVPEIKEQRCSGVDIDFFWGHQRPVYKGNVWFRVHWEAFSPAERRVVLSLATESSAVGERFKSLPSRITTPAPSATLFGASSPTRRFGGYWRRCRPAGRRGWTVAKTNGSAAATTFLAGAGRAFSAAFSLKPSLPEHLALVPPEGDPELVHDAHWEGHDGEQAPSDW